jgi:hypothetical protein
MFRPKNIGWWKYFGQPFPEEFKLSVMFRAHALWFWAEP